MAGRVKPIDWGKKPGEAIPVNNLIREVICTDFVYPKSRRRKSRICAPMANAMLKSPPGRLTPDAKLIEFENGREIAGL